MEIIGALGGISLLLLYPLIIGTVLVALWRGMKAQEDMARSLEQINQSLERIETIITENHEQ